MSEQLAKKTLKEKLFIIIFEADTRAGQLFDKTLIFLIVLSLLVVGQYIIAISVTLYIYFCPHVENQI